MVLPVAAGTEPTQSQTSPGPWPFSAGCSVLRKQPLLDRTALFQAKIMAGSSLDALVLGAGGRACAQVPPAQPRPDNKTPSRPRVLLAPVFLVPYAAAGGVRTGGYPKTAPVVGPLGYQRPTDWDLLWSPARSALRAVPTVKAGQLVSAVPGMYSLTKKVRGCQ